MRRVGSDSGSGFDHCEVGSSSEVIPRGVLARARTFRTADQDDTGVLEARTVIDQ